MSLRHSLLALPILASFSLLGATAASAQGVQLFAVMLGANETSAADPDGYGAASVTFHGTTQICVGYVVDRIRKPTAAHIHEGDPDTAGPIVVSFGAAIPDSGNPGHASLCTTIASALATRMRNTPSDFYVNVHNADFPGGAIRGQLF